MEFSPKLSFEDLNKIIKDLLTYKPQNYELVVEGILQKSFIHLSKIQNALFAEITLASNSLDVGDFIVYLIGKKAEFRRMTFADARLCIDLSPLQDYINNKLIRSLTELNYEINELDILPLKRVHYLFLFYPKDVAKDLFRKQVALNYNKTTNLNIDFASLLTSTRFFERLQLDFIPCVDAINYKSDTLLENNQSQYITQEELHRFIDTQEWHHTIRPLAYLDAQFFINPVNDIIDYDLFREVMVSFFKRILPHEEKDVFEIFYSNITKAYPNKKEFLDFDLIYIRDTIKDAFFESKSKPNVAFYEFCAIVYHLNGETLLNLTKRLPVLMEEYLGGWASSHTLAKCCFRDIDSIPTLAASIRVSITI